MSCPTFETVSMEVDGELSELEAQAVRAHVSGCESCRARRQELLSLNAALRRSEVPAATESLRARLVATVRNRRWVRVIRSAAAVAVAAAAVVLVVPTVRDRRVVAELIGDHVGTSITGEEPFDVVNSDPRALERWFAGKISYTLRIPQVPAARLLGARLCNVKGEKIPLASYDRSGHRMSLFAMGKASGNTDRGCEEGVRGFTVCRRAAGGVEYMLVTDYPGAEAKQLLVAALSPQQ
jgi:anti-sigma factor RsiW